MSDNNSSKILVAIISHSDGTFEMKSSLPAQNILWILEQAKLQILTKAQEEKRIVAPGSVGLRNRIINFVRRIKR